jgi:Xaa-Pro aminopeptidase
VLAMNPTLLVGPADWDPARMPREEFSARLAALWQALPSATGAIVYGDWVNHAELAYLTHFTPKLEAALALIPRVGAPQLLVGGGANMLPAAKPLTFIEDLRPLRNVGQTLAQWARAQNGSPVLIGGSSMPFALHQEVMQAFEGPIEDRTDELHALMRCKSARELATVREACVTLQAAMAAIDEAQAAGASATAAILAGERAANRRRAQEVRTLLSLDRGRTLRPFETLVEDWVDPLQVYVAVRQFGYWTEGFAAFSASPNACTQRANEVLHRAVERMQAGERCSEIARSIAQAVHPFDLHPVTARVAGNGIGLALEESPLIAAESQDRLEPGGVYSLRVGLSDGREHAIVSAMVAIQAHGYDVLWSSAQAAS